MSTYNRPNSQIKTLQEILLPGEAAPSAEWQLKAISSDQCLAYVAWNLKTQEALVIDPKAEDLNTYREIYQELKNYLWLGVIDSHTHADHLSIASQIAEEFNAPLIMHYLAPSKRVQVRISKNVSLASHASPIQIILTPGHTQDSITPIWGPFLFGGDTLLYGDVGRDDLPGGSAEEHFESLQIIKKFAKPQMIVLPGHDTKGGRASSWKTQLEINTSLQQSKVDFIREAIAFDAPAPQLFKKSLSENFK